MSTERRLRRLDGWGFQGEAYAPSRELLDWLGARLGELRAPSWPGAERTRIPPPPRVDLPVAVSADPRDRLTHARGQGLPDLLRLRSATVSALPAAVVRPTSAEEIGTVLAAAERRGYVVVPRGGGTSVTGGVTVLPDDRPVVSLDLEGLAGLRDLDETSRLATFGAGTYGPELEAALASRGFTLGHFPQSWELSTLGGWVAARSSGQESMGRGRIEDLVAGVQVVAPAGRLDLAPMPASAAGPDLRQLVLGSEGRFGVITEATVRVSPRAETLLVEAFLLPAWEAGLGAARELVQAGVPLTVLRVSDESETQVALAVGLARRRFRGIARGWLALRGVARGCLVLAGASGTGKEARRALVEARTRLSRHGAVPLGRGPGERWKQERFRHPYLRDALLDLGVASDTFETAAPWSRLPAVYCSVRAALSGAAERQSEGLGVLCHLSHPYRDGCSLYFTFFFRTGSDVEEGLHRWAELKRSATAALVAAGATLSHHHGIGTLHAPWYEREVGPLGRQAVGAVAATMDPRGVLNPSVLLDPDVPMES